MARHFKPPQRNDGVRINGRITAPEIRVVDHNGEMAGVMTPGQGLELAQEVGLDLVEVSPNAKPPVCKIIDYGKYKYEQQKKANEARKKQKTVEVKELKMRPTIEEHDYQVKLKKARQFISEENKVKFSIRFRGREMAHQNVGREVFMRIIEDMKEEAKTELRPKMEGRQMIMILAPDKI